MRKLISIGLGLLLFLMSMNPVLIKPDTALAAGDMQTPAARVVSTVGDGLRYYVIFEYNGNQYRSDNVGPAFNMKIWERLGEEDRRQICRNYAFAPSHRKAQFGEAGSSAMVDWVNEVSGWKEAGEAWENAIGAKTYPDLTAYFTGDGYNNLQVDGESLNDVRAELLLLLPEVKDAEQYQSAFQLIQEIEQEYAAGQAIYEKLKDIKAKQVGNAFKAGSEVLIKDIIIDNLMVPSVTPSAKKASELIAGCISFLKDRCVDLYEDLVEEPSAAEILQAMQEMLDILETTDNALISDINGKLEQLSSQLETLRDLQATKMDERQQQTEQKKTTVEQNADTTFAWSEESENYDIPAPDPEMTDEEREAKRAQVQAEADNIKTEFENLLTEVVSRKNQAYTILGYDDGQVLTNHPSLSDKYFNELWVWPEVDGPTGLIDLSNRIDPAAYFSSYHPYSETKAAIASGGAEIVSEWTESIKDLETYIEEVEDLISDQALSEGFTSVAEKVNGLNDAYSSYVGGSLDNYVFDGITYETIQNSMEIMLTNENQEGFYVYEPFATDYDMLAMFHDQQAMVQKNMEDFADETTVFESDLASGAAEYDSLYTNLQNSAAFMYGAYTSRKNLYRDRPYFTFNNPEIQGENVPIVDEAYVNGLIAAAPEEQKDAVIDDIIDDLHDLRALELEYLHKITTGKNNVTYDANKLDYLLTELGIHFAAYENLGELIGKDIKDSSQYLQENDDFYRLYNGLHTLNLSNISQVIEGLEGTSDAYYNAMLVADEIISNAGVLRSLSNEDFEMKLAEYESELEDCMSSSYGLNQVQISNVRAQYNRGYDQLLELRQERYPDENPILVEAIYLVLSGTDTPADQIELNVGETCQLEADIYPADATNQLIFWSSDNLDVATVNYQGLVSAVAEGTAYITAASADGNAEADCYVVVGDGGGGPLPSITVNCETPQEGTRVLLSNPILQVSGSIDAGDKVLTEFKVIITSHADMEAGDYEGILVPGIGPGVVGNDNRFAFTVDLRTLGEKYLVPGSEFRDGYQLYIWVVSEDASTGYYLANYLVVEEGSNGLEAAKAAAANKVQADYTAASWATLTAALALPETTDDEIAAKTAAINNALGALEFAGAADLAAAKTAAAGKVQSQYTAASWAVLTGALAMPETTQAEVVAKTTAVNNAIAGLVSSGGGGSSSGSGGSSSTTPPTTPPPTTPPTTTGGTTTASTSTNATLDTATGTATAPVSTAAMTTLTNQAKAAESAGQKAVVAIKVEAAPEAKAVQLEIPKNSFAEVANDTQADVAVETPLATITFDNKAVETINNASATGDVSISVASVDKASLPSQTQAVVGDQPVYDFSVKAGNTEVSSFEGGKAQVSIPYTPQPGEKQESIVVYYIDNHQNLVPVRGAFNPATNTVDFEVTHFSKYVVAYNEVGFQDVKDGYWYSKAVKFLAARDIVSGIGNGCFGPNQKLTRGQYVVMVMRAYGINPEPNPTTNFADAGATYYTGYLAAAKKLNLVSGIGNNMFAPERLITRQEMFTMLYNTLQVIGELPAGTSGRSLGSFRDAGQIAFWAEPAMKLLVETGAVSGSEGLIRPVASSSRAEMAQVLFNLLNG